mgnify:CR=1 FL=1
MELKFACPGSTEPGIFAVVFTSVFAIFLLFDVVGSMSVLWTVMKSDEKKES